MDIKKRFIIGIFLIFYLLFKITFINAADCTYSDRGGWSGDCTNKDYLSAGEKGYSKVDWGSVTTEELQNNEGAAEWALKNKELSNEQKEDFFSNDKTNLNEYKDHFKEYAKDKYGKDVEVAEGDSYKDGKIITKNGETKVDLKITADSIKSTPTGVQIDTDFVSGGNVWEENNILRVDNANNVVLRSERSWFIDYAKEVDAYGAKIEEVYELSAEKRIFTVKSADSVRVGCILAKNVRDSTFTIAGYALEITSAQGISYDVYYNDGEFVKYSSLADGNIFTADARYCFNPSYTLKNTSLNITTGDITETIIANNTAFVEIDEFGIACTNITAIGSYFYDAGNITTNFGFKVFDYSFRLCIRKEPMQRFDLCSQCGVIDTVDKRINLDGAGFSYLRYSVLFHESGFSLVFPLLKPMYESTDLRNKMEMVFDNEMLIGNLSLENLNAGENNISVSASGSHRIIEMPGTRLLQIIRKQITSFVQLYKTSFTGLEPDITVDENGTLVQHGKNAVKAFAPESKELKEFEKSLEIEDFGDFRKP